MAHPAPAPTKKISALHVAVTEFDRCFLFRFRFFVSLANSQQFRWVARGDQDQAGEEHSERGQEQTVDGGRDEPQGPRFVAKHGRLNKRGLTKSTNVIKKGSRKQNWEFRIDFVKQSPM